MDVWVGSIPAIQATKTKLKALFESYGRVINVTVRYKPRSALNPDNNKSWAVLTYADKSCSSRCLRAETVVDDDDGQPHKLKVSPQEVERNRAMRANEETGPGKMEDMVAQQQADVEKRMNSKGGGRKNRGKASEGEPEAAGGKVPIFNIRFGSSSTSLWTFCLFSWFCCNMMKTDRTRSRPLRRSVGGSRSSCGYSSRRRASIPQAG